MVPHSVVPIIAEIRKEYATSSCSKEQLYKVLHSVPCPTGDNACSAPHTSGVSTIPLTPVPGKGWHQGNGARQSGSST